MASNDYIPADDVGLQAFSANVTQLVAENFAAYGLVSADDTAMDTLTTAFNNSLNAVVSTQSAARVARTAKDTARTNLVVKIRELARRIQAHPTVTDAQRIELGLTVKDSIPTAVSAPTSQPVLFIDTSNRLAHTINFRDSLTPLSKAKPSGVLGCEIYRKIGGTAPSSVADCEFLGTDSASPYLVEYGSESGGLMVHYLGRWATRSGLTGPTSDVIGATVVA